MEYLDPTKERPKVERIIVVPPAAPGSKGDEGMLLGALRILNSVPVHLLNPEKGYRWTDVLSRSGDVSFVTEHQGAFADFLEYVQPTDAVLMVGADVIDGTCGSAPAFERLDFLEGAVLRGARAIIVCSFRSDVDQRIVGRLKKSAASVFLRDIKSLENYLVQVGPRAEFFPDLSYFAAPPNFERGGSDPELIAWLSRINERGGTVVGLNFSEHMFRSFSDEHTDEARSVLVRDAIDEILKAIPDAFFVTISNDNRQWPNFISDADYQEVAAEILASKKGEKRFRVYDPRASYLDNIVLMRHLDLLVTGRMHLAHAAVRQGTIPLILMGSGRGYTSTDKMRGMYETVFETNVGVVDRVGALSAAISWAREQAPHLSERLKQWNKISRFEEEILLSMLVRSVGLSKESPSAGEMLVADLRKRDVEARLAVKLSAEKEIAQAAIIARSETEVQQLKEERDRQRAVAAAFMNEAERLVYELFYVYRRPWRPINRTFQRGLLKFALLFRSLLSERTVQRFQRSLQKRKPSLVLTHWEKFKVSNIVSVSSQGQEFAHPAESKAELPKIAKYRLLRLLSKLVGPFSRRQAEKFRRSAEKRNPWRSNALVAATRTINVQSIDVMDACRARRIFVADYRLPRADTSAGERATIGLISDLRAIGYEVVFAPTDMNATSPYLEELQALGVEVITRESGYDYANDYIRENGRKFGAFYFIRVDVAEALLAAAREAAPDARIIFHAPDLYSLRENRAAELSGNSKEKKTAEQTKARETAIMQAADHVVLVSSAEIPYVKDIVQLDRVSVFPALYSSVVSNPPVYQERQHLFFIGGFAHRPNISAVKWFVDAIWPAIHARLPEVEFHIIGAEVPEDIVRLGERPGVRVTGYVADLAPTLTTYRLSVVPLLYGAGIKGKLGMAMGAGVPSVVTTVAAEGMNIIDGVHALIRDEPLAFAQAVVQLYQDKAGWEKIARGGQALVEESFGEDANQASFLRLLDRAGALPLDLHVKYCQSVLPSALPGVQPGQAIDVSIIIPVHNQWPLTRACLNSMVRACRGTGLNCEIILADDVSTDDTLRAAELFPNLKVVRQEDNLGFLHNCNAAAATASGRYILFLNNDTVVMPTWLTALVDAATKYPDAAIIGSKLLDPDGTIQDAGAVLFADATAANLGRGRPRHDPQFGFDREVDYVPAVSALISRSFWDEVGGFDERYAPGCCGDSDLAMAARSHGMRVMYAAKSEAVHFGQSRYDAQTAPDLKTHQLVNDEKLLKKWSAEFAEHHLLASVAADVAAAHAERVPSQQAKERRRQGRLNILYFSPFPSHPDNHGNQATIQSFGRHFQRLGHKVHFALLGSSMFDDVAANAMRDTWDTFDILHNTCQLWANGNVIPFDHWYQEGLGEEVACLCRKYDIDLVFCSYVFQSRLLEYVPSHILKVIDTHDKMGNRYEMLRQNGQPLEFFSCSPEEEGKYLRRADIVAARRAEEAKYFNEVSGRESAIVIPHVEESRFVSRNYSSVKHVGVVASANLINLAIVRELLEQTDRALDGRCPFVLHIAGQVKDMVGSLSDADQKIFSRSWVNMRGFVKDIGEFYREMDLIISPVTMGTGINVKTVQAMAYGMPLLTTKVGIKGIETDEPLHNHRTIDELVKSLLKLERAPERLNPLAAHSMNRYRQFLRESDRSIRLMFTHPKICAEPPRRCFCGGDLVPLVQFGRSMQRRWRTKNAQARCCNQCAYVTFDIPAETDLKEYYSSDYGNKSEGYYEFELDYAPTKVNSRAQMALDLAARYRSEVKNPVFLELGCAFGGTVAELRRRGHMAFGIDINSSAIEQGRERGNPSIFDYTPQQFLEAEKIRVDVIISYHMLEHVPDPLSYLRQLAPVLNDDAVVMFRVPNGAYLKPWVEGFDAWDWFAYPDHLHMLTQHSAAGLVSEAGYELVAVKTNACGESESQVRDWAPKNLKDIPDIIDQLGSIGLLMELEFVFRKRSAYDSSSSSQKVVLQSLRDVEVAIKEDVLHVRDFLAC